LDTTSYKGLQSSKAVGYLHTVEVGSSNLPSPIIIPCQGMN
jgi:hypothetical protein